MLIDTHAHLNFAAFKNDREKVIENCLKNNIWMINVGTDYQTSKKAIEIAENYSEGIYAAIGLHPNEPEQKLEKEFDFEKYKELGKSKKVVAIGEIGLDYWYKPKTKKKLTEFKEKQKQLLLKQLRLAQDLNLPVIFHCRLAHNDLIKILQNTRYKIRDTKYRGVIHCFTGNWEQAQEFLEMGFYLGFNGIIFKLDLEKIIKKTPLDRILIETDCPYLTPPNFGEDRNNPLAVKIIAQKIAEVKNISFQKVAQETTNNAKRLFKI